jgi:hypothetical protein
VILYGQVSVGIKGIERQSIALVAAQEIKPMLAQGRSPQDTVANI